MTGTCFNPSCFAAKRRACPARTKLFWSIKIGLLNPSAEIALANLVICSLESCIRKIGPQPADRKTLDLQIRNKIGHGADPSATVILESSATVDLRISR